MSFLFMRKIVTDGKKKQEYLNLKHIIHLHCVVPTHRYSRIIRQNSLNMPWRLRKKTL